MIRSKTRRPKTEAGLAEKGMGDKPGRAAGTGRGEGKEKFLVLLVCWREGSLDTEDTKMEDRCKPEQRRGRRWIDRGG